MRFPELTIAPKTEGRKGRTFTVHLVAAVEAQAALPPASNRTVRPVLLAYCGTAAAVRALSANLRAGETAATEDERYELLRSLGYRYEVTTPRPGEVLVIAYLPELFHLHPGVQEDGTISFVSAPPVWWLDRQEASLRGAVGEAARDHARAMAFVARLDARTPLPIANEPAFHHALYERALAADWILSEDDRPRFSCRGLAALGLERPVFCHVEGSVLAEFLAAATAELLVPDRAPVARPAQAPVPAADQLLLDFAGDFAGDFIGDFSDAA